jgi:mannan endo-1,4-beta-mannosidase
MNETPPTSPATQSIDGRRARRIKVYVLVMACIAIIIGAVVAVALAQPSAGGSVHQTSLRYLGIHVPDAPGSYAGVDQFAQAIGRQPNLVSYYSPWLESFQAGFATSAAAHKAITLVQIDPTNVSLAEVAAGRYDAYLLSYAAAVKAFGAHIVLSFGHEMNGNWSSWGYQHTSSAVFVAAWRHIVTLFRSAGADNVTWMWTVNIVDNNLLTPIPDPSPWWPGRAYVNWVGIDGYYYDSSTTFSSLFGPTIVDVRALTQDPILIAETGAEPSAGQPAKINDLFNGIRTYGLLGFVWFDENTEGRAWRITTPGAFAVLRRDARAFLRPPPAPVPAGQRSPSAGSAFLAAPGSAQSR